MSPRFWVVIFAALMSGVYWGISYVIREIALPFVIKLFENWLVYQFIGSTLKTWIDYLGRAFWIDTAMAAIGLAGVLGPLFRWELLTLIFGVYLGVEWVGTAITVWWFIEQVISLESSVQKACDEIASLLGKSCDTAFSEIKQVSGLRSVGPSHGVSADEIGGWGRVQYTYIGGGVLILLDGCLFFACCWVFYRGRHDSFLGACCRKHARCKRCRKGGHSKKSKGSDKGGSDTDQSDRALAKGWRKSQRKQIRTRARWQNAVDAGDDSDRDLAAFSLPRRKTQRGTRVTASSLKSLPKRGFRPVRHRQLESAYDPPPNRVGLRG